MTIQERITEQAASMFFRNGIRSVTMDEIAESLGISKRTLYEGFTTKAELLKASIEYKYKESLQLRNEIESHHKNDVLEVIYQHFRYILLSLNDIHPNFFKDIQKYHSRIWFKHIENKQEENIAFTESIIKKGKEQGLFRENVDGAILSRMIHAMLQMMHTEKLYPETRFARAEVAKQVMFNFIRGLATAEGLKKIDEKIA